MAAKWFNSLDTNSISSSYSRIFFSKIDMMDQIQDLFSLVALDELTQNEKCTQVQLFKMNSANVSIFTIVEGC